MTMPHRSHEWPETLAQLRLAFGDPVFAVHGPVPPPFGDEGAANHMRLAPAHDVPGVEIFVHGIGGGGFPVRQHPEAGRAIARAHGLDPARTLHIAQSEQAIAAGAFHNDVVAVADGLTLLAHEQAFADRQAFYSELRTLLPELTIVEVPASAVPLTDAIRSYLFNAQLVTLPEGGQALVLPAEARETPSVWSWLQDMLASNGPIRRLEVVDVRQSMANGGGPACLRLRVACDPASVDPRFLVDQDKLNQIAGLIEHEWPESVNPDRLDDPDLWSRFENARTALLALLDLTELA